MTELLDPSAPDPERDALDARPSADDAPAGTGEAGADERGRLRVYLGMAPGVGKTWRMLEEGHRRLARGTDLAVGFVEVHGRPKTAGLVEGLEVIPRRRLEHRGVVIEEMDAEAVLTRNPTVALVDELAHTNIPGSVRAKRWEDVEVLRDAGIHVVSTMNVQHLESVADAVATITGTAVNERLPDEVLLGAEEIELVDMSPHALRQRIIHGNVYPPDRVTVALDRMFTEANLTALRELALRFVAERVEGQLEGHVTRQELPVISDRVVVLVDGSPASLRAVRRGARLAGAIHAALIAVVIDTPDLRRQPFEERRNLREAIDDALDLGAEVVRVEAADVVTGLQRIAQSRHATHVVLPHRQMEGFSRVFERSPLDRLLERLPDLEVTVVGQR